MNNIFKAAMYLTLQTIAIIVLATFAANLISQKSCLLNASGFILLVAIVVIGAIIFYKIIRKLF